MTDVVFSKLVPELKVSDLEASLRFWRDLLGFAVRYSRPEEGFAFLEREGAQIMLHQDDLGSRPGVLITGDMQRPFGRGINFEIDASDLAPIIAAVAAAKWPSTWGRRNAGAVSARSCRVPAKSGCRTRTAIWFDFPKGSARGQFLEVNKATLEHMHVRR